MLLQTNYKISYLHFRKITTKIPTMQRKAIKNIFLFIHCVFQLFFLEISFTFSMFDKIFQKPSKLVDQTIFFYLILDLKEQNKKKKTNLESFNNKQSGNNCQSNVDKKEKVFYQCCDI